MQDTNGAGTAQLTELEQMFERESQTFRGRTDQTPRLTPSSPGAEVERRNLPMALTRVAFAFLLGGSVLFSLAAVSDLALLKAVLGGDLAAAVDASFVSVAMNGLALSLGLLVPGVLFLVWSNLAYKAANSRGATGTSWGSGWAIGGWFIPFGSFFLPKQVMNEIDRMSGDDLSEPISSTWKDTPRLAVSDLWWALWVGSVALRMASGMFAPNSVEGLAPTALVSMGAAGTTAGAGVFLAITVLTIGRRLK